MVNKFEIKEEHLKLLKKMYVGWQDCEFGSPEIDPKRPYGNSDVHDDMVEILGWKQKAKITVDEKVYEVGADDWELPQELIDKLDKLHKETETALQICLKLQTFEVGEFECDDYDYNWRKI